MEESLMQKRGQMFSRGGVGGGVVLNEAGQARRLQGHCVTPGSAGRGPLDWLACMAGVQREAARAKRQVAQGSVCVLREQYPTCVPWRADRARAAPSLPPSRGHLGSSLMRGAAWTGNVPWGIPV